ncbi:MAG TPA: cupin domain-containing protein [Roseiflexaceae bacterium]|nr:cupin domain-containing protein [Roseiflexaceae bacterium]
MDAFELKQLLDERGRTERAYLEFLRVPALSAGLYVLPSGATDPQQPHTEDEVYYIVSGRGAIQIAGESRDIAAGSIVYVKAGDEHRFHSIAEQLVILVFFAPAEYTQRRAAAPA